MTAIDVEVQVVPAPTIDVEIQFGDAPTIDVAVQIEPPTFTVMSVLPTGPRGPAGIQGADGDTGPQGDPGADGVDGADGQDGADGAPGVVQSIVAGTNVTVDDTDPANPVVASTGGSGDLSDAVVLAPTDSARNVIQPPDADSTALTLKGVVDQAEAMFLVTDDADEERVEAFANGSINQYLSDPAVIGWLIKLADAAQAGAPFRIVDPDDNLVLDFDNVNRALSIYSQRDAPEQASQSWYAQAFSAFAESDIVMIVAGRRAFELDSYVDNIDPTNNYTTMTVKTQPSQTREVLDIINGATHVTRVLPSGAIGTSAGEPADADINTSELFFYRDDTPGGIPHARWKTKDSDDVVSDGALLPVLTGTGSPEGAVIGEGVNSKYEDINSGALYTFLGTPGGTTGWACLGGKGDAALLGLTFDPLGGVFFTVPGGGTFQMNPDGSMETPSHLNVIGGLRVGSLAGDPLRSEGPIGTSAGEPADGDINPGECFRWFDPTNGAACVKYKGKTLNGTVVTSTGPMT